MKRLFNFMKKETDAERLYQIYECIDIGERIKYIVESEYKKMIYTAERAALNKKTSFIFELTVDEEDMEYFNIIMSDFITTLTNNGFGYTRNLLTNKSQLTIYFAKIDVNKD